MSRRWMSSVTVSLAGCLLGGCGYSEDEWKAQLAKYEQLSVQHQASQKKLADLEKDLLSARDRSSKLERELESMGVDMKKLNSDLDSRNAEFGKLAATQKELEAALAEYKRRAEALERIKQRFEQLRSKLDALTKLGLTVNVRNNRMMISLPGDVLFDSGKDTLKQDGKDILDQVAQVINGDASLRSRTYQVAGHTDSEPFRGGIFRDNWGLSLMRARTVLLYLIDPEHGALPEQRWSAAGFAATDPVSENETPEGRRKNRRCELVVVPNAEEMLDLKNIAQ